MKKQMVEVECLDRSIWVQHNLSWTPNMGQVSQSPGTRSRYRIVTFQPGKVPADSQARVPQHHQAKPRPDPLLPLRGTPLEIEKSREDDEAVGGLRCTARATARVPAHLIWGPKIRTLFDEFCDAHPQLEHTILQRLQ